MPRSLLAHVRAQFEPQRRRDQGQNWWKLPDDVTRTSSSWRQLVVDLVVPATFSRWHRDVAVSRVESYDRLRPPVTRAVLIVSVAVCLWWLSPPWWLWGLLMPAVAQVTLEIGVNKYFRSSSPEPSIPLLHQARDVARANYNKRLLNVTGGIGIIACPMNVAAVALSPAGADHGWLKIAALAAAILYVNSGLASAFLDPPNFSEQSRMPVFMHTLRPYAPALSYAVVTAIVAVAAAHGRWQPELVPIAYLTALLALLLGSKLRDHDRMIAAAIPVARRAIVAGRADFARATHDELNATNSAARRASGLEGIAFRDATTLGMLPSLLSHLHQQVEIDAPRKNLPLEFHAQRVFDRYRMSKDGVSYDFAWGALSDEDHHIALRLLGSLCLNVAQALELNPHLQRTVAIRGEAIDSQDGGRRYFLSMKDWLPPIDSAKWCRDGSTMSALRTFLQDEYDGNLVQEMLEDGSKQIVASWADMVPLIEFGDTDSDPTAR
jgi:hypothetical protein